MAITNKKNESTASPKKKTSRKNTSQKSLSQAVPSKTTTRKKIDKKTTTLKTYTSLQTPAKKSLRPSPYGTRKYLSIDDYHREFPTEIRRCLDAIRSVIREAAPHAEETISYNMPAFRQGKNLVYYCAHKFHLGLYPTSEPIVFFAEELKKYKTSKGAIQFPYEDTLPVALIKKIVKHRVMHLKNKS